MTEASPNQPQGITLQKTQNDIKGINQTPQAIELNETADMVLACNLLEETYGKLERTGITRDTIVAALRHVTDLYE